MRLCYPLVAALAAIVPLSFAQAQETAAALFFEGDMVRGGGKEGVTGPTCVLTSQFKRQEMVVWRIRVRDAAGQDLGEQDLQSLAVTLPDGQSFPARYGDHPRDNPTDKFWAAAWRVPADYPTGTFAYTVVAKDAKGAEHQWSPFNIALSQLSIIEGEVTLSK